MTDGWIKLHRCLLDKAIWKCFTAEQRCVMITILLLANHEPNQWIWKGKKFELKEGQFITSLESLAVKAEVSVRNVRTALAKLVEVEFITDEVTSTGRLITVVNWDVYQIADNGSDKPTDKQVTNQLTKNRQTTDKEVTTNKNDKNDKNEKKDIYNASFEEFWKIYAKKKDKGRAYECYKARLVNGFSEAEMLEACKNYMAECKKNDTPLKYIKDAKTFLGVNTPFVDYLPKKDTNGREYEEGLMVFNFQFPESEAPPFYGLPEEWFEGGELIESRVTGLRQPKIASKGQYKAENFTRDDVMEQYRIRRDYYARQSDG